MKRMAIVLTSVLSLLASSQLRAGIFPEGAGMVYGQGFSFELKAPKGWILDTDHMKFEMFTPGKDGKESVMMEIAYTRKK